MSVWQFVIGEAKEWVVIHGRDLWDSACGAFVYFIYGLSFKKQNWRRGLVSFVIGTLFAMYVAPQICESIAWLNHNFVVFVTGLMGMRFTETLLDLDLKTLIQSLLSKWAK